jgi:hypothetical protein
MRKRVYLTRVTDGDSLKTLGKSGVLHLATNKDKTLCNRYLVGELVFDDNFVKTLLGGITLEEFLSLILDKSIKNECICSFCISKFRKVF